MICSAIHSFLNIHKHKPPCRNSVNPAGRFFSSRSDLETVNEIRNPAKETYNLAKVFDVLVKDIYNFTEVFYNLTKVFDVLARFYSINFF